MPLIAIALLVLTGAVAVDASLSDAGFETEITAEEFNASAAGTVTLNESNRDGVFYNDEVSVRDDKGREMVAGEDYEWNETNGTINVLSGGDLVGTDPAEIDYGFRVPSDEQSAVADVFASGFEIIGLLLIVLAGGAILAALGRFT